MSDNIKISGAVETAKDLVKTVSVYREELQPAAKQLGKALETIGKSINLALLPLKAVVWAYEDVMKQFAVDVAEQLHSTPPEDIQTPKLTVAGPVVEALRFTGHEPDLRSLYVRLLAASLDRETAEFCHPAFVEVIKQLSPDEARLLQVFAANKQRELKVSLPLVNCHSHNVGDAVEYSPLGEGAGCEHPHLTNMYKTNLCRLSLIDNPTRWHTIPGNDEVAEVSLNVTPFGYNFIAACVIEHQECRAHRRD